MYQKFIAIGRTTSNFRLKYISDGTAVANFDLAINKLNKDAIFIPCVVWGDRAKDYTNRIGKGSLIFIEGEWKPYEYHSKESDTKITYWQVEINQCRVLERREVTSDKEDKNEETVEAS